MRTATSASALHLNERQWVRFTLAAKKVKSSPRLFAGFQAVLNRNSDTYKNPSKWGNSEIGASY
jgi:hypothetical protein